MEEIGTALKQLQSATSAAAAAATAAADPTTMSTERQPLLGQASASSAAALSDPPTSWNVNADTALVNVHSDDDASSTSAKSTASDGCGADYDPAQHRRLDHPTSNLDTLIHLLKGNIGTGILAMPDAFRNAGLYVGLLGTLLMGAICTHCMHMLVGCAHELSRRQRVPSLSFSEVCHSAFATGPPGLRRHAAAARQLINVFLCITQLGFCCVYFVFVAVNLQHVVAHYANVDLDKRVYLVAMLLPMIGLNLLRNLKYLTPVSLFASVLTVTGLVVTFHYLLHDLPRTSTVDAYATWAQLPLYFGTAIYAFEGIGVVLPLENNMKTPGDFGGMTGVLNTGMVIVACLYTSIGFFGYLKYGDAVRGSITLNLPSEDILAQSVQLMMALAIFLSYGLQFYVPINIMTPWVLGFCRTERAKENSELGLRVVLVVFTFVLAAIVPDLELIISLVGAFSSSTLALIFPPIIEIITFWPNGLGRHNWVLWKDLAIMVFGIMGFVFGTYASVSQMVDKAMAV